MILIYADDYALVGFSPNDVDTWRERWPCSTLPRKFSAAFDSNGLVEVHNVGDDVDGVEFNAICADAARAKLPHSHECFFIMAGQFEPNGVNQFIPE